MNKTESMQTVVLHSDSKSNLKLLTDLAKKIGVSVKYLSDEDKEEIGLTQAIRKGRSRQYVDTEAFIDKLLK
jgi:hypothetical protein